MLFNICFGTLSFPVKVLRAIVAGTDWTTSARFPRVTLCDFLVRRLANVQRYTVQCVLPINLFNEKIFLFVWSVTVSVFPLLLLIISVHQVQGLRNGRSSFRPSARLSRRSTAATVAVGFAAERRRLQQISIDSWGAVLQAPALISKCGQHHVGSRWTRLNTDLY